MSHWTDECKRSSWISLQILTNAESISTTVFCLFGKFRKRRSISSEVCSTFDISGEMAGHGSILTKARITRARALFVYNLEFYCTQSWFLHQLLDAEQRIGPWSASLHSIQNPIWRLHHSNLALWRRGNNTRRITGRRSWMSCSFSWYRMVLPLILLYPGFGSIICSF